jgi:hypothetical protein
MSPRALAHLMMVEHFASVCALDADERWMANAVAYTRSWDALSEEEREVLAAEYRRERFAAPPLESTWFD